jgi:hypothetical protein
MRTGRTSEKAVNPKFAEEFLCPAKMDENSNFYCDASWFAAGLAGYLNSTLISPAPVPSTARNRSSDCFVFSDLYPNPVQPEEPPTLRDHLLRELDRRLLLAADPQ